jgi:hypothetical protein
LKEKHCLLKKKILVKDIFKKKNVKQNIRTEDPAFSKPNVTLFALFDES